jgi:hypothetical protein
MSELREEDTYMKIKCTILFVAVLAACLPVAAQRPGANPPSGSPSANTQPSANQNTSPASATTQPQVINSELFISRIDSSLFTLILDETQFGAPAKSFNLTNLTPGYHHIKLVKPTVGKPIRGMSVTPEVLYDGYVNVPEASRVTAVNSGREQLNIVSIVPLIQYILGILGQGGQNGTNNGGVGQGFPWGWPPLGPQAMAGADFEMLKSTINGKAFDSDKLSILRMAMMNNHFTASQVTQLVSLFDFESNKVNVAKALYSKVIDKGNYYLVNNAFNFSSSSSELAEYITGFAG